MGRFKCLTPGVRGLYVRIANVALLSSTTEGGAKPAVVFPVGGRSTLTGSTTVA